MKTFTRSATAAIAALVLAGCGTAGTPRQSAGGSVHPPGWGQQHAPASEQIPVSRFAAGTSVTQYDSVTLATIPPNPFALAGYTSGFWPTYLPMRSRWPTAHTVSIAVNTGRRADCLDVEPGDATPSQVPGWVRADRQAGFARPCIYSSYFEFVTEIRPALQRAGISRESVWEWDADYTYRAHIDLSFDGTQWTDVAFGRNLDASTVTRQFLSIAQPPLLAPAPKPPPVVAPSTLHLQLVAVRDAIIKTRGELTQHRCRTVHGRHAFKGCPALARKGQGQHAHERTLLKAGAR